MKNFRLIEPHKNGGRFIDHHKKNQKTYTLYLTNSPAVSFCVTSLPSPDEASADVSPIVSVADTRK